MPSGISSETITDISHKVLFGFVMRKSSRLFCVVVYRILFSEPPVFFADFLGNILSVFPTIHTRKGLKILDANSGIPLIITLGVLVKILK